MAYGSKPGVAKAGPAKLNGRATTVKAAPAVGQLKRPMQSGTTNPATDAGGGRGNSTSALHKQIFGKC